MPLPRLIFCNLTVTWGRAPATRDLGKTRGPCRKNLSNGSAPREVLPKNDMGLPCENKWSRRALCLHLRVQPTLTQLERSRGEKNLKYDARGATRRESFCKISTGPLKNTHWELHCPLKASHLEQDARGAARRAVCLLENPHLGPNKTQRNRPPKLKSAARRAAMITMILG